MNEVKLVEELQRLIVIHFQRTISLGLLLSSRLGPLVY